MKKIVPIVVLIVILGVLLVIPRLQSDEKPRAVETPTWIEVEIVGAIHMPGIYEVVVGTTLQELITYALGTTMYADIQNIHGTTILTSGVKYVIPVKGSSSTSDLININQANLSALMSLPGIGQITAQKIIDYRTSQGPFMRIEDIQLVSGIGAQTFEQIKTFITI